MKKDHIKQIKAIVTRIFANSATSHDLSHTKRVVHLTKLIAKQESVNINLLEAAAWLHDIGRAEEDNASNTKNHEFKMDHATIGAKKARKILEKLNIPSDEIEIITDAIQAHRFRKKNPSMQPNSMVAKILYDADKLDSIGAIGIARAFAYAGENNYQLYSNIFENKMSLGDYSGKSKDPQKHTPYIEFKIKLQKIKDTLFTEKAKEMGKKRHEYMIKYFEMLFHEIHGLA